MHYGILCSGVLLYLRHSSRDRGTTGLLKLSSPGREKSTKVYDLNTMLHYMQDGWYHGRVRAVSVSLCYADSSWLFHCSR